MQLKKPVLMVADLDDTMIGDPEFDDIFLQTCGMQAELLECHASWWSTQGGELLLLEFCHSIL